MNKISFFLLASLFLFSNSCARRDVVLKEEFSAPEKTYKLWVETAEKGDIPNNIRCVTEASKKMMDAQLKHMNEFMRRMTANLKVFKTYTISEIKIKEDRAVILLKGPTSDTVVVPFSKEADGWKVDLIAMFSL